MEARPIIICIAICLAIFVVLVAIVVTVVVVLITPRVKIEQYTAETRTDYGFGHVIFSKEISLDDDEYCIEQFKDGFFFSRIFCNDDDSALTICNRVGDHDSCYKLTSYANNYYTVPRAMSKEEEEVDCPTIHDPVLDGHPKRKLTKCDKYVYDSDSLYREAWVESSTEYPVLQKAISYKDNVVESNVTIEYTYFDGSKPQNKTGLEPPEGAIIFDFTYGTTGSSSLSRMISKFTDKVKSFFSNEKPNIAAEATMLRFKREKLFRERAGLFPISSFMYPTGSAPASMKLRSEIPDTFDARSNWNSCSNVIGTITNQKTCGSCWAMSSAAVLSDRACINNISSENLSPQYMMSCYPNQLSCNGGFVSTLWQDIIDYGTVSEECYPFVAKDTECPATCQDGTPINSTNIIKVRKFYSPWAKSSDDRVKAIQTEIMTHGPVSVAMLVFSGLDKYKSGVYHRKSSEEYSGGHMVRIIGWGADGNDKYWLVANSWGEDWGLKGLFKIRRGTNECNIENAVVAGLF